MNKHEFIAAKNKEAMQDVNPAHAESDWYQVHDPGCAPIMTPTKFFSATGYRRILPEDHRMSFGIKDKTFEEDHRKQKLESATAEGKEATKDVVPADTESERYQDKTFKEYHRKQELESATAKGKEPTKDVIPADAESGRYQVVGLGCAPMMNSSQFLSATGSRRSEWGKDFELRFGNKTASKQIRSAHAEHNSKANQDRITVVVSSIHDLLTFNPETTIIEFDSDIEGKELGRLFRMAKALRFKYFVRNYTLARARLHHICSSYDGERRGRNLDAEAKELLRGRKEKKK